ncbi:isochorismatase family protein [Kutzneria sp. CA-103260]|uniref:isochorismatase family protein n=1 Tax=Kutzneria sp. CA-103260 TaxID=2802641 RepID=UPI001BACE74D|nr:isochorismatase family protein [Kutzneria sp. CA-103260]QUQ64454.1 isochorismatase family protein [Kutzneria sp. CA-103260]
MAIPDIAPYPMPGEKDLPESTPHWKPDPRRAALLIHDMQKYFVEPFLAHQSPGRELIGNVVRLLRQCRAIGVPVVYTAQPGSMTDEQRGLLKDFWGPGMKATPEHRRIIDELTPDERSRVFTKWRYSAFARTDLLGHLRELGRDQLVVCGVYAHVGCLMTAVDAFTHDVEPFLVADAVADFSPEHHRMAVDYAAQRCAVVLSTEAALEHLR